MKPTKSEHMEPQRQASARNGRADSARHARVLLLLAEGCTWAQTRAKFDSADSYISRWSRCFEVERLAGLFARHARRERYKVTETLETCVLEWTTKSKLADGSTQWSSRKLAAEVGGGISHSCDTFITTTTPLNPLSGSTSTLHDELLPIQSLQSTKDLPMSQRFHRCTHTGRIDPIGCRLLSGFALALVAGSAFAQTYPVKPIRVIDAYPPGGGTDIVARTIGPRFQQSTGQTWVVDNRPGAQGIIGTEIAAKSAPDGYTLLMFTANHTVHPSIYKGLPYDLTRAFVPVTRTTDTAIVLVVHPSVPVTSVKELIAFAKAKPGRLNYASAGAGGTMHMATELFTSMTGTRMNHIPYKGAAPAVLDTVGGHVDLIFAIMPTAAPHIRSGRLRALGVSTQKRTAAMPELPTIAEAGLPGYESTNASGVLAPAGTPPEIVAKLQQEIARILAIPDVRERLLALGAEPVGSTPEQFADYVRTEIAKWAKVVKATGMELQTW